MDEKRRWYQLNLWKAIAVMLAIGWLVDWNFIPYYEFGWPLKIEVFRPDPYRYGCVFVDLSVAIFCLYYIHRASDLAFQNLKQHIHLSTAMFLMVVAGGLLWLNMKPHTNDEDGVYWYGWPRYVLHTGYSEHGPSIFRDRVILGSVDAYHDLLIALSILFTTAWESEQIIRVIKAHSMAIENSAENTK